MSFLSSRSFVAALSVSAVCFACGADQKSTNTADNEDHVNSSDLPATGPTQPTSAGVPNPPASARAADAEPPAESGPQGAEQGRAGNVVASPKPASATVASPLSESQIAMVAELANKSEIEQGKLAQGKAKNASVKKFAAMMVKHHTEAKDEQAKLFKQLKLTPTQSQTATTLKQNAEKTTTSLRSSTAADFDDQYIASQIEAHQQVLDTLNSELIPSATEQELIAGLNKMKATVEAHLSEAKSIQTELQAKPR